MERRDCCKVISEMMNEIPSDKTELIKDLEWNFNDAKCKAPEENIQWHRTHETVVKYISNPTEEWEFKVLSIFTTYPIEDIKKMVEEGA